MNELASILKQASDTHSPLYRAAVDNHKTRKGKAFDLRVNLELVEAVRAALSREPKFLGQLNVSVRTGGGSFGLDWAAPQALLNWAKQIGAQRAISRLSRLLSFKRAPCSLVIALGGIHVKNKVRLLPGVDLMPFEQLPASGQKDGLANRHNEVQYFGILKRPSAALVGRVILEPLIYPSNCEQSFKEDMAMFERLRYTQSCLAIVGPCSPIALGGWWQFESPFLSAAIGGGTHCLYNYEPAIERYPQQEMGTFDETRGRRLVRRYISLGGQAREKVDTALGRFNQSLRRIAPGDAAIDLAIALECLVTDGGNSESSGRSHCDQHYWRAGAWSSVKTTTKQ